MRILHVDKFYDLSHASSGGVGSYIRALSARQRRRGHEVLRFGCVTADGTDEMPRYFDFTRTRNPFALQRMIHNAEAAGKLAAFLRRRSVDVAHLHNIYHHLTPSILPVLARRKIPILMTVHDYRLACPTKNFYRDDGLCTRCAGGRFYRAAGGRCASLGGVALAIESYFQKFFRRYLRWIEFFLCPTEYMRDVIVASGVAESKAILVPLPLEEFPAEPRDAQLPRELLYAGRLSAEKGPDLMLDLAECLPDAHVNIVGDGPMLDDLRRRVSQRGIANVTIPGHIAHEQMVGHYARATVVVLPSRCMENSPLTMLEAMSARRCVVVADQPPLRQWVRDGVTGRLFTPGSAESLASVVREVLADADGRGRMTAAAKELVSSRHCAASAVGRIEELYKQAARRCALRW